MNPDARAATEGDADASLQLRRPGWRGRLAYVLEARDVSTNRAEVRIVRRLQFAMVFASVPMISLYGLLFVINGHLGAAAWCGAYVVISLLMVVAVAVTGRFSLIRQPHNVVVAVMPFGLTLYLGGLAPSGGVWLWTLFVPVVAALLNLRGATWWFGGVVITLVVAGALVAPDRQILSPAEVNLHFTVNAVAFLAFLFLAVRHLLSRIEEEKARAERLLLQVLPAPIVRRLKRGQKIIADHFEGVTVVFADLVGFTQMAARLPPAEVVSLLDDIFTRFDELAAKHGVEKIKTIGDAYMAVAGAPEPCTDHAARAARLALAMRDLVRTLAQERGIELSMRIGIHTGEVVAGVIGIDRFAYDLWGDTVNTASRMESHGHPNDIQVTGATKDALGDAFATRERGPIEVKGRGTIVTYWLDRAA